ncbi:MAG: aspartate aminotransferase, partial [Ilumatobacteraceae bacterium]
PNVTEAMSITGHNDVGEFATAALHNTGVSFCTRRHFGRQAADETEQYIRLAYSGIGVDAIEEGLQRLADWVGAA